MSSFVSTDVKELDSRQRTTFTLTALLAGALFVEGFAKLFMWQPFADAYAMWGLPVLALPIVGALEIIAAASLLVTQRAALFISTIVSIAMLVGTLLYLRNGDYGLALLPLALCALSAIVAVLHAPGVYHAVLPRDSFIVRRDIIATGPVI